MISPDPVSGNLGQPPTTPESQTGPADTLQSVYVRYPEHQQSLRHGYAQLTCLTASETENLIVAAQYHINIRKYGPPFRRQIHLLPEFLEQRKAEFFFPMPYRKKV